MSDQTRSFAPDDQPPAAAPVAMPEPAPEPSPAVPEPVAAQPTAAMPQTLRPLLDLRPHDPVAIRGYTLLGRLPGHHASDVFVARSTKGALSVVKLSGAGVHNDAERVEREAGYLGRVRSPRVAKLIEAGAWEGRSYIVQDFIDGPTLAEVLDGPASMPEAYRVARGLAEALRDVHRAGVVHRDVKPSNIIISEARGIVLVDFGIAWVESDPRLTQSAMAVGTPRYMSPERMDDSGAGVPSDVFGWGLVVGEALLGRHPIEGIEDARPALRRCATDPELAATSLGRLVRDALQYRPELRPSLNQILAELDRTDVLPEANQTLSIPLPERRLQDIRTLDELHDAAAPILDDGFGRLADKLWIFVAGIAAAALLGWLVGFLVGAVASTPWS